MAQHFYGLNRGSNVNVDLVTIGTSTGSTDVELRVDDSKGLTKKDVTLITRTLLARINDQRTAEFGL